MNLYVIGADIYNEYGVYKGHKIYENWGYFTEAEAKEFINKQPFPEDYTIYKVGRIEK